MYIAKSSSLGSTLLVVDLGLREPALPLGEGAPPVLSPRVVAVPRGRGGQEEAAGQEDRRRGGEAPHHRACKIRVREVAECSHASCELDCRSQGGDF